MSTPPREGARWGDDPPEPVEPSPQVSTIYPELCEEFGEANVESALKVRDTIAHEYPHLSVLKADRLDFAKAMLNSAKNSMEAAARDGRIHSMPETLKEFGKSMGEHFAKNPSLSTNFTWHYGDLSSGNAAKKAAAERKDKSDTIKGVLLIIAVGGTVAIGFTLGWGVAAFIVSFLGFGWVIAWFLDK